MPVPLSQLLTLPMNTLSQVMGDNCSRIGYSQLGEDFIIYHALTAHFPNLKKGFYVDVGAHHPRRYSNTKFLHMLGWRGINIDANEKTIALFNQERPGDINLCVGIGTQNGEMTYYDFADSAVSTFSAEWAQKWRDEFGWTMVATKSVPVRVLGELLDEVMPLDVPGIDVLSIDIEGMDEGVATSFDFERPKYRPKILAVELHSTDIVNCHKSKAVQYLMDHGYRLIAVTVATFVFIDTRVAVG